MLGQDDSHNYGVLETRRPSLNSVETPGIMTQFKEY